MVMNSSLNEGAVPLLLKEVFVHWIIIVIIVIGIIISIFAQYLTSLFVGR